MDKILNNKKAYFNYEILDKYITGIKLVGSEIKPTKKGNASISESYCAFKGNELFLINMNIINDDTASGFFAHEAIRDRKLLLKKKELKKLQKQVSVKGLTIVPLSIKLSDVGLIKVEIGLCRGKKTFDKKDSIKERDIDRETNKAIKDFNK